MQQGKDPYKYRFPGRNPRDDDRPKRLRNMKYYIINALKFYDMKNENLPPVVFVIILFTGFSGTILSDLLAKSLPLEILYNIISFVVLNMASAVYLKAYLNELRGEVCTLKDCAIHVLGKFYKIVLAYLAFFIIIAIGLFLLVIPGIVFCFMFLFNTCYIVDKNFGVMEAFNTSRNLTNGVKMELFALYVVFSLVLYFPLLIVLVIALYTATDLIFSFILSFISTIIAIMRQRLIAMVFKDLEYGVKEPDYMDI